MQAISATLDILFPGAEASPAPAEAASQAEPNLPKGEIEATLDAVFPEENAPPIMTPISSKEIAAILDKVLPEDPVDGASGSGRALKPFVVPYDFELRCLMNSKGETVSTDWIPTGFIRTLPSKSERN